MVRDLQPFNEPGLNQTYNAVVKLNDDDDTIKNKRRSSLSSSSSSSTKKKRLMPVHANDAKSHRVVPTIAAPAAPAAAPAPAPAAAPTAAAPAASTCQRCGQQFKTHHGRNAHLQFCVTWNEKYTALTNYIVSNQGTYPNRKNGKRDLEEWCRYQRQVYTDMTNNTTTRPKKPLTPAKIAALERLPNWCWTVRARRKANGGTLPCTEAPPPEIEATGTKRNGATKISPSAVPANKRGKTPTEEATAATGKTSTALHKVSSI